VKTLANAHRLAQRHGFAPAMDVAVHDFNTDEICCPSRAVLTIPMKNGSLSGP
jgi:hypothetical protein